MKKIFILFSGILLTFHGFSQDWLITGNAGTNPGTNFLGTSDTASLVLRTDNTARMLISSAGNVGIGTLAPTVNLTVYSATADHHLRLEGFAPSIGLLNGTNATNTSARFGLASASGDYASTSVVNDAILGNYDSVASLLFVTNNSAGNGIERMRINKIGYVGIANTKPLAKLDVNCVAVGGQTNPSNIRFENLQTGTGTALMIDSNGYVYKASTASPAVAVQAAPLVTDMQGQVQELQSQVQELRSLLATSLCLTQAQTNNLAAESSTYLGEIYPNPANTSTTMTYSLPAGAGTALIQVYGLDGKVVSSVALPAAAGKSQVQLATGQLAAGMYIYALVVDGKVLDSKKLAVVR